MKPDMYMKGVEVMEQVITLLVEQGVTVGVIFYFMITTNTTIKELTKAVSNLTLIVEKLNSENEKS